MESQTGNIGLERSRQRSQGKQTNCIGVGTWTEIEAVRVNYYKNVSNVDVAFNGMALMPYKLTPMRSHVRPPKTILEQLKYKYILNIEGNDVATGLKWQLVSNSMVFMATPTTVSYAMEDTLIPFVHYVPVRNDYSNLEEMVEWARKNDAQCQWIAEQSNLYMEKLWMSEQARKDDVLIKNALWDNYRRQFGVASKHCVKERAGPRPEET